MSRDVARLVELEAALPEVLVSRGTLLNTMAFTFQTPQPAGDKALTARVRLLETLGVPRKARVSRNAHMQYGLSEATEIAVALALMNAHMPPALAARYVKESWRKLASLALAGMLRTIPGVIRDLFELADAGPLALIEGNILRTLGGRDVREGVGDTALAPVELFKDASQLGVRLAACSSGIVLNAGSFSHRLLGSFLSFAPPIDDLQTMLDQLRDAATGEANAAGQSD